MSIFFSTFRSVDMKKLTLITSLVLICLVQASLTMIAQPAASVAGLVLSKNEGRPLPYVNVYIKYSSIGTISNENGEFQLKCAPSPSDTIVFQSLGYKTLEMPVPSGDSSLLILLPEEIFNLDELLVYATAPDPAFIIQNILKNKPANYPNQTSKSSFFIRSRNQYQIKNFDAQFIESDIKTVDKELVEQIKKDFPPTILSFIDVAGTFYRSGTTTDSVLQKVVAAKAVSLEDKNLNSSLGLIEEFNTMLFTTSKDEYWDIKTGLLRVKMDDSVNEEGKTKSTAEEQESQSIRNLRYTFKIEMAFANFESESEWDFLYKPQNYQFAITGGTFINGEETYIIDFKPGKRGLYTGRLYVSAEKFALIKADYYYSGEGAISEFGLLGIGMSDDSFKASIYFEKGLDGYHLKYLSRTKGNTFRFDRDLEMRKRKERFLMDKTLQAVKIKLTMKTSTSESTEILLSNTQKISSFDYRSVKENKKLEIQSIQQFDDEIWKDYSIIEPTKQMKEYNLHRD